MTDEHAIRPPRIVLLDADMAEPLSADLGTGRVAAMSVRSPVAEGPNEDAAVAVDAGEVVLFGVADGYGGGPTGERASQLAVGALSAAAGLAGDGAVRLVAAGRAANRAVLQLGTGAATTLAAVAVEGDRVSTASVGDSMIVVVGQRGKLKLRTVPHSPVGYAVESGMLDEADAMHHEARHFVSNMVGEPTLRMELTLGTVLSPRDTVIAASDGLWDNLHLDEVLDVVRTGALEDAAAELARRTRARMIEPREGEPSKCDDCTFILFRPS
ncbi:MAG: serine/threonine protein phosphatase [Deltaproteobacteria bacterium]|nr:MAG: serine/threonine protein phosphatase [Deltaproteobacteria bacterium]